MEQNSVNRYPLGRKGKGMIGQDRIGCNFAQTGLKANRSIVCFPLR